MKTVVVLLFGALTLLSPATAAVPTPATQVSDPVGDANFLSTPWWVAGMGGPFTGNNVTPTDASDAGDLIGAWYTQTPKAVVLHIRTERPPGDEPTPIAYRLLANYDPYWDWANLHAIAAFDGTRLVDARMRDTSCSTDYFSVKAVAKASRDGSGLIQIFLPRKCPATNAGAVITGSTIATTLQPKETVSTPLYEGVYQDLVTIDMTERGDDYVVGP